MNTRSEQTDSEIVPVHPNPDLSTAFVQEFSRAVVRASGEVNFAVEFAILGSRDPQMLIETCTAAIQSALSSSPTRLLFYKVSVGLVAAFALEDGRSVVLKAHQGDRTAASLSAQRLVQSAAVTAGLRAPEPLAGPFAFGSGHVTFDRYVSAGVPLNTLPIYFNTRSETNATDAPNVGRSINAISPPGTPDTDEAANAASTDPSNVGRTLNAASPDPSNVAKPVNVVRAPDVVNKAVTTLNEINTVNLRETLSQLLAQALIGISRLPTSLQPNLGLTRSSLLAPGSLYPVPHSPIFDFVKTAPGAEWIDEVAARALAIIRGIEATESLPTITTHCDLRAENVHLSEDGKSLAAIWDWDSIETASETWHVGTSARAFSLDFSGENSMRTNMGVPTVEEMLAFIGDCQTARGQAYTPAEYRATIAWMHHALAYSARCEHALASGGVPIRWTPTFADRLNELQAHNLLS
jgi:hypothetical protein